MPRGKKVKKGKEDENEGKGEEEKEGGHVVGSWLKELETGPRGVKVAVRSFVRSFHQAKATKRTGRTAFSASREVPAISPRFPRLSSAGRSLRFLSFEFHSRIETHLQQ